MNDYLKKLKDPRWQKKRLEIFQRDNFKCQNCGSDKNNLQVHHHYYDQDKDPWDYPNESLITLCEDCHDDYAEWQKNSEKSLIHGIYDLGCNKNFIDDLYFYLNHLETIGKLTEFKNKAKKIQLKYYSFP